MYRKRFETELSILKGSKNEIKDRISKTDYEKKHL